jgi:hypothetical protein
MMMESNSFGTFVHGFPGSRPPFGGGTPSQTRPFLLEEKEQAEVGQSPTLLALRFAMGFCVSSGDTLGRYCLSGKGKQDTLGYPVYRNIGTAV